MDIRENKRFSSSFSIKCRKIFFYRIWNRLCNNAWIVQKFRKLEENSSGFDVTLPNNHSKAPTHLRIFIFNLELKLTIHFFLNDVEKTRAKYLVFSYIQMKKNYILYINWNFFYLKVYLHNLWLVKKDPKYWLFSSKFQWCKK